MAQVTQLSAMATPGRVQAYSAKSEAVLTIADLLARIVTLESHIAMLWASRI